MAGHSCPRCNMARILGSLLIAACTLSVVSSDDGSEPDVAISIEADGQMAAEPSGDGGGAGGTVEADGAALLELSADNFTASIESHPATLVFLCVIFRSKALL